MPSLRKMITGAVVGFATLAAARPLAARQSASGGLTDTDILQFALTLEHLEATFYKEGFAKFPDSEFMKLGLSQQSIDALKTIAADEATHVTTIMSVLTASGVKPVEQCEYNFGFTDAAGMVATARILEAVGVSAYLGAAPFVNNSAILSAAASIVTVEARHQTFIRIASAAQPVPGAFDAALGVRSVFTLAAAFIKSCPSGSNLNIQAFPALQVNNNQKIAAGTTLTLQDIKQPEGAMFCAFTAGGVPGGTLFVELKNGVCTVPQGLVGEVYMTLTKSGTALSDDQILAGPSVLQLS